MRESLPNTIDYFEMPSRNLAETEVFWRVIRLVVGGKFPIWSDKEVSSRAASGLGLLSLCAVAHLVVPDYLGWRA